MPPSVNEWLPERHLARFAPAPSSPDKLTPVEVMAHHLNIPEVSRFYVLPAHANVCLRSDHRQLCITDSPGDFGSMTPMIM